MNPYQIHPVCKLLLQEVEYIYEEFGNFEEEDDENDP